MTVDNYTYLLAHPHKLSEDDMSLLTSVIEKYPYLQSAHALQLKGLKKQDSYLYNDALKITAAYTTDRDILFDFITSESFSQNQISQAILKHDDSANDIEVVTEDVSEAISVELDNRIKAELRKAEAILNPDLFERKVSSVSEILQAKDKAAESEAQKLQKEKEVTAKVSASEAAQILELDKPLDFTKSDTHSFSEWLQLTKSKPIERTSLSDSEPTKTSTVEQAKEAVIIDENQQEKQRKFELIEKFIQKKPKLIPNEPKTLSERSSNKNLAKPYTQNPDALMTETLAKVYLQQKNYNKAITAYKILILKYPEKSGFFADQIRAVKNLINTEEQ